MSHGKETPRQKMINLMYLILTCLLALNVSRDVLLGFVNINESIEKTNLDFSNNTAKMLEAVEEAIKQGHEEVKPYYAKAKEVTSLTRETVRYIDSLKKQVILYTENTKGADTLLLRQTEKLDDYDRPTFYLLGDDETSPRKGQYSAAELRAKLEVLADTLLHQMEAMHNHDGTKLPVKDYNALRQRLLSFKPIKISKDSEGKNTNWETKNFFNQPMAAVVTNLSRIQGDVRNLEAEMVNVYASAAGKLAVHFDQMEAKLVPQSEYIQAGSEYKASVFLTASSSAFTSDNLQFILGEVDTATGQLAPGAQLLPYENGNGKIILPSGSVGHKDVKGWIRLRDGSGNYKYFRYNDTYIVANSAVAVSAEKMNMFYIGVDNPVSISAAGVAPEDLHIVIEGAGGTIKSSGNGKYNVSVNSVGQTTVTVFEKTAQGLKRQGEPRVFRVRKFPDPPLKIQNRIVSGVADFSVADARNIRQLSLDMSNFNFAANFKIQKFSIYIGGEGQGVQVFSCDGDELSADALRAIQRIRRGGKIYFEDIKVEAPDGPRMMGLAKVNVR